MANIILKKIKPVFKDNRGVIFDLVDKENISHIGLIVSKPGSVRGQHYHKTSKQITYILSGKIELTIKDIKKKNAKPKKFVMEDGDIVVIPPLVAHSFKALEETTLLAFTDKQRNEGSYEEDTVRIEI